MFIALIQAAIGGLCSTLALTGCVSTTLETTADHPAHASDGAPLRLASLTSPGSVGAPSMSRAPHDPAHEHQEHHHLATAQESASGSDDAVGVEKAPAASWTCPMHPEVVRDEPGKCPTCGMKLVEKEEPPASGDEK